MNTHRFAVGPTILALGIAALPLIRPAVADDDDRKLLDKQPAVIAPIYRPDPWKLASRAGAVAGNTDDVFQMRNVILKAWLPLNSFAGFPGSSANGADCWGYVSPSGREYALMGLSWGNGIVEVTDPANPHIITTIPGGVNVLWRDITFMGHYAYAVSDSQGVGIQVIDLSQIDNGVVTLVRNYSQAGHTTTHTLLANPDSGFLYACGGNIANGGFKPISLANDPTFPTFTGTFWTTSYVHEAQILNYTSGPYAGHEIAYLFRGNSSAAKISIVDVTNKANLITLSSISYPGSNYSHQGWLSPDKKYLYHNDEIDGPATGVPRMLTRVFDVSDLTTPRLCSVFSNGLPSVDHNEYVRGRYLFQSNYTTGLHVWDLTNPLKPVEVAWIDTRPDDDGTGYNGAWGNYEFGSGTVIISDLERGLFVVQISLLEMSTPSAPPATLTPGQATPVSVQINEKFATTGPVDLMVSVNGGPYAATAMSASGGGVYTANLPAASNFDRVNYYFRAQTDEATPRTFTWPLTAPSGDVFRAYAQTGQTTVFADNFENDLGWTVQNTGITAGAWVRGTPLYNGGSGAVIGDADGSGQCFVTGNTLNNSVMGGTTRLLSPVLDLSNAPEARVSYSRWLVSTVGNVDPLVTEVSADNGANWVQVSSISPATGGWDTQTFRVADFVTPTSQVRVRFSIANTDTSTTEAGIDAFSVVSPTGGVCYANCDGSTAPPVLNVNDFICFQTRFAAGEPYANCDGSTAPPVLNVNDFICFQTQFATGCP